MDFIKGKKLVLASKSPRRKELLSQISSNIEIRIQEVDEIYPLEMPVYEVASFLSQLKSKALFDSLQDNELIITADTLVILDNKILGKPKDSKEAFHMLRNLSGKKHDVVSACTLLDKNKELSFSVITEVYFKELSEEMIDFYITNFKPFDKAGSYGIQEWIGMVGIERINGSYYNVMGLPVSELCEKLKGW
jgi:septum formation protein